MKHVLFVVVGLVALPLLVLLPALLVVRAVLGISYFLGSCIVRLVKNVISPPQKTHLPSAGTGEDSPDADVNSRGKTYKLAIPRYPE
jgi:hypothetical protein